MVVDLNTEGKICTESNCLKFYKNKPKYYIHDMMYMKIQFVDPSYSKYLNLVKILYAGNNVILNVIVF